MEHITGTFARASSKQKADQIIRAPNPQASEELRKCCLQTRGISLVLVLRYTIDQLAWLNQTKNLTCLPLGLALPH